MKITSDKIISRTVYTLHMDLSEKEITLLSAILGRIAGRGCYLEQLANELDKLGVEHYPNHCLDGSADLTIPNNWGEGLED